VDYTSYVALLSLVSLKRSLPLIETKLRRSICEHFSVMNRTSYGSRVTTITKAQSSIERSGFLSFLQVSSYDTPEDVGTDLAIFISSTSSDCISTGKASSCAGQTSSGLDIKPLAYNIHIGTQALLGAKGDSSPCSAHIHHRRRIEP
jgi:hypothetical protein